MTTQLRAGASSLNACQVCPVASRRFVGWPGLNGPMTALGEAARCLTRSEVGQLSSEAQLDRVLNHIDKVRVIGAPVSFGRGVGPNGGGQSDAVAPFCGFEGSGHGRGMGHDNVDADLQSHTVWSKLAL